MDNYRSSSCFMLNNLERKLKLPFFFDAPKLKILNLWSLMINKPFMPKERLYWTSQFIGWFIYILLMWVLNRLDGKLLNLYFYGNLATTFVLGILISHGYRAIIIKLNWLRLKIIALIPRVILASAVCGLVYFFIHTLISDIIIMGEHPSFKPLVVLQTTLNLSVNFIKKREKFLLV